MGSTKKDLPDYVARLAGKELQDYRIVKESSDRPCVLGEGKWAYVLKALGPLGDFDVKAIKVLKRERAEDPTGRSRFIDEIKRCSGLRHPNIVMIERVGEWDNLPYYVMEYVDGKPIDKWATDRLQKKILQSPAQTCSLIRQILNALSHVHSQDFFHLDLKPANILITASGIPKLADFGLAQAKFAGFPVALSSLGGREFKAMHPDLRSCIGEKYPGDLRPAFDLFGIGYTLERVSSYFTCAFDEARSYLYAAIVLRLTVSSPDNSDYTSRKRFRPMELDVPEYESAAEVLEAIDKLENPLHHLVAVPELQMASRPHPPIRISSEIHVPTTERMRSLIVTPLFQRLGAIRQLDLIHYVYPGALHSRLEHSLGCYYYTLRYLRRLLQEPYFVFHCTVEDLRATLLAALLHDIAHYPMAHAIAESAALKDLKTHEELAQDLLNGTRSLLASWDEQTEFLKIISEAWGVAPALVARIAFHREECPADAKVSDRMACRRHNLLHSIVNGPLDADKMHYLQLDSRHTGNPVGAHFDSEQLIDSLCVGPDGDAIAISEKGLAAAESFLYGRYRMHIDVYWHHTVRAARKMVARAIDHYVSEESASGTTTERRDRVRAAITSATDRDFLETLLVVFPDNSHASKLLHHLVASRDREDAPPGFKVVSPRRAIFKRIRVYSHASEDPAHNIFEQLRKASPENQLKLEESIADEIARRVKKAVEPWEVIIDVPPSGEKERWPKITVRYPKRTERDVQPLDLVSAVAREIGADFWRNAQQIRVYVSPRVRKVLREWAKIDGAGDPKLELPSDLNLWVQAALKEYRSKQTQG